MKKFVLIDHSIKGLGGHHYEYASHVLDAARDEGYEPVLAVNKAFRTPTQAAVRWKVVTAYEYGFWAPVPDPSPGWTDRLQRAVFACKTRWVYSRAGYASLRCWQLLQDLLAGKTPQDPPTAPKKRLLFISAVLLITPFALLAMLGQLILAVLSPVGRGLQWLFKNWSAEGSPQIGNTLCNLGRLIAFPPRTLLSWMRGPADRNDKALRSAFARGTRRVFEQVPLSPGDVVFIPTLSERDMLGLLDYFASDPSSSRASWHLLFRRNLFIGSEEEYGGQEHDVEPVKSVFNSFLSNLNGHKVRFYTDTNRLTRQYNLLNASRFDTLPIPVNPRFSPHDQLSQNGAPLKIVYAGDARREKGYHLLPDIVDALLADAELCDKVTFEAQSNFAHARLEHGTEEMLARTHLAALASDRVKLHLDPLDSERYADLVRSADIVLILYDPRNYYARSSGILIEALSAGLPVVVPSGSWMHEELVEAHVQHCLTALARETVLWKAEASELEWDPLSRSALCEDGAMILGAASRKASLSLSPPSGATHMVLTMDRPQFAGAQVIAWITACRRKRPLCLPDNELAAMSASERYEYEDITAQPHLLLPSPRADKCALMVELDPAADKIWLGLWSAVGNDPVRIENLQIAFIQASTPDLISEAAGGVYFDPDEINDCVKRVVRHYAQYRQSAVEFSEAVRSKHSVRRLVRELIS